MAKKQASFGKGDDTKGQRAALYLRVSTEDQAKEGYGLDAQMTSIRAYALAFNLEVVAEYRDEGISGTKGLDKRKGLKQALDDAQENKYDFLIAAALDRLARKTSLLLSLWESFEDADISIVCVKERIDTSTAVGRLMRTVVAAIAEFEAENIAARTRGGREERGKIDGEMGGRMPYGYARTVDGDVIVVPAEAATVREIFGLDRLGWSLRKIMRHLNEKQSPPKHGARWYASTVNVVLNNEYKYKGGQRNDSPVRWPTIL
jgi:site-specific DNA recombinase